MKASYSSFAFTILVVVFMMSTAPSAVSGVARRPSFCRAASVLAFQEAARIEEKELVAKLALIPGFEADPAVESLIKNGTTDYFVLLKTIYESQTLNLPTKWMLEDDTTRKAFISYISKIIDVAQRGEVGPWDLDAICGKKESKDAKAWCLCLENTDNSPTEVTGESIGVLFTTCMESVCCCEERTKPKRMFPLTDVVIALTICSAI